MKQIKYDPTFKYVRCYCDKKQTIRLGWGLLFYGHILAIVISIFFFIFPFSLVLNGSVPVLSPVLILMSFLPVFLLLLKSSYRDCFKDMMKEGHTKTCSHKVALKAMWRQSLYSIYKINVDPGEVDPQGDYGTPAVGIWSIAIFVNLIYIVLLGYENSPSGSIVFPILFTFSITASTVLIIRIKHMRWYITVICLLNIISSGILLAVYGLRAVANLL